MMTVTIGSGQTGGIKAYVNMKMIMVIVIPGVGMVGLVVY